MSIEKEKPTVVKDMEPFDPTTLSASIDKSAYVKKMDPSKLKIVELDKNR